MSDTPPEFDLKFLPDWLKEGSSDKKYAEYEGGGEERGRFGGDRRDREDRGGRGDRRGPRPARPGGAPGGRAPQGDRPPGGPRREGGRGDRRDGRPGGGNRRPDDRPRAAAPAPEPVVATAEVKIDFLPEPNGALNIAKQIKQSGRAYPLFGTGRLFLERPERHRVRITSLDAKVPLHQIGDGPVSFDRAIVERNAFRTARDEYYKEEVTQGEPLKGNFANVARSQSTGLLIGPTNHHSYQPTLRRIYEERFSRRMSFQEFVQREIEVVNDEQTINDWKDQARSTTTYTTTKEAEPIVFKSAAEAEQHFRKVYLPQLVKSGITLDCSGQASRSLPDRSIAATVREMWEKERAFPAGLVNYLRPALLEAGLHFFKHRKRILYISAIKPVRHAAGQVLSTGVAAILNTIGAAGKCTRRQLAVKILGEHHDAPEAVEQKAALARDLHYLVHTGNVIEFHDGSLELPLAPGGAQPAQQGGGKPAGAARATQPGAAPNAPAAPAAPAATAAAGSEDSEEEANRGGEASATAGESIPETSETAAGDRQASPALPGAADGREEDFRVAPLTAFATAEGPEAAPQPAVFSAAGVLHPAASSESASLTTAHSLSDPQADGGSLPGTVPILTDTPLEGGGMDSGGLQEYSTEPVETGISGRNALESNAQFPVSDPGELSQTETPAEAACLATAHSLHDPHGETSIIPSAVPTLSGDQGEG